MVRRIAVAVACAAILASGCGKAPGKRGGSGPGSEAATLPAIDADSALPVDGGRVAVMSPEGWLRSPRSKDYLVRYTPGAKKTFPSVVVLAADAPAGFSEVTDENHREFAAAVGDAAGVKKTSPLVLGDHRAVAWSAPARAKVDGMLQEIDRSCVAVVIGGRMYTVEARAPKGRLDAEGRGAARAVAAALGPPEAAAEPAEPSDTPAADAKPADAKPAEAKSGEATSDEAKPADAKADAGS